MIDLGNGYVIVQTSPANFDLRQKYMGIRKGVETECLRTISHHPDMESAIKGASKVLNVQSDAKSYETLQEYAARIEKVNESLVECVHNSMMKKFYVYVPVGNGKTVDPHPIVELIPVGRDNAISRQDLLSRCISAGITSSDRTMRELITKARMDFVILNLSNGKGYYRLDSSIKASLEEMQDLQRYIRQEESRAKVTFKNISMARKLYEDYKAERIT